MNCLSRCCRRFALITTIMFVLVQVFSAATDQDSKPNTVQVDIENYTFKPMVVNVVAGTTVTWVNHDVVPHDVASKEADFKSDLFAQDERFSFKFTKPGVFPYLCATHPKMTGTVVVQ
jgi:plastocyanin